MKINEATEYFKNLLIDAEHISEVKLYHRFIRVLSSLKSKELSDSEMQSIEAKLESLELNRNTDGRKQYLKQKLREFLKFLKEELSLISEGYYRSKGAGLGLALGAAFGAATTMGVGIAVGLAIGLGIGGKKDREAEKENRVLA